MMGDVRNLWRGEMLLGEGPAWDVRAGCLWFVDIKAPRVHRYDPVTGGVEAWEAPTQVGWVLPAADGTLIAGLRSGPARFDPATGRFHHLAAPDPHPAHNRLNDATVAPDGTIWFGTMDDEQQRATGRVFHFDGKAVAATGIDPVTITNGPASSPDGRLLYHVDTTGGMIHAVPIDAEGRTGSPRLFARIDAADGHPDGVTVDAGGNVWVGLWGGWRARLYSPEGAVLREVRLPAANVTKVALGGPDLRTAFVTTARIGLDDAALADQPDAGSLFSFEVEVPGQALPPARV
ncbi:SMP-30/gluconolactonase/LRE family protein [Sphingomonas rubra]|uniref:Sugar lactone lactonase YvrE n=1 Tax=Sphingomonas rubra TaxID=634430 RepID=A0A1I5REY5_9SPHN|nr:SMP-30/gluconolactonase/LRE family protein [Sphingomonas rubra]SFP57045.1 Sugar lactone lactonase YvrE [Sphingomonas rubra]